MAAPNQGYSWANISALGTVNLIARHTTFRRVAIPGTYIGTVNFYDAAATTGTAAGNLIISLGLPATSVAGAVELDANCKDGLTYSATGTPAMTVFWD